MIVNPNENGWEVIYQRTHALLAMQIAAHWKISDRPTRWLETLAAILQHDNGGDSFTGRQYLTEAGTPRDFKMPGGTLSVTQIKNVTQTSLYQGRWVALLTSIHISSIHEPERGHSAELDQLLDEHRDKQARWHKELDITKSEVEQAYRIFRFSEELSLILCHHELPAAQRKLEIWEGFMVTLRDDHSLTVTPWCFEEDHFSVAIEATCLKQMTFKDDADLHTELMKSDVCPLEWKFAK